MHVRTDWLWLLSGAFLGSAFIEPVLWWCVFVGLYLLFVVITKTNSYKRILIGSFGTGLVMNACVVSWCWSTYPISTLESTSIFLQLALIGLYIFLTSFVLSYGVTLFALSVKYISSHNFLFIILAPVAWVFSEMFGAYIFSVGTLGEGSVVGIDFSFNHIGYVAAQNPLLLKYFSFLGVYSLSYVLVLITSITFIYCKYTAAYKRRFLFCGVLFLLIVTSLYVPKTSYTYKGEKVVVVETYFDKTFFIQKDAYSRKRDILKHAVVEALKTHANTILLPEDSRFSENFTDESELFAWIHSINQNFKGVLIDSGRVTNEHGDVVMRAYVYDVQSQNVTYTDKQYLVPQGEYIPYLFKQLLPLFVSPEIWKEAQNTLAYTKGSAGTIKNTSSRVPAILFCSESVSPFGVRNALNNHSAEWIAHPISHAWYTKPTILWYQLDNMLRVQASWNKVPIVSANNMSESKLYLPSGEIKTGKTLVENSQWSIKQFDL